MFVKLDWHLYFHSERWKRRVYARARQAETANDRRGAHTCYPDLLHDRHRSLTKSGSSPIAIANAPKSPLSKVLWMRAHQRIVPITFQLPEHK